MLIFDQLKKNDPPLRVVAVVVLAGLTVLVAGLWWVQIVSSRDYQAHLEMQSFRTVRIPAVRGKILDRSGTVVAENQPAYNVNLYLDALRTSFNTALSVESSRVRKELKRQAEAQEKKLARKLTKEEKRDYVLTLKQKEVLARNTRFEVASNVVQQVSQVLRIPLSLSPTNFERHYQQSKALPFPICTNLSPAQIAMFEEQCTVSMGVDVEMQCTRVYPYHTTAAHLLGSVRIDNSSIEGEDASFSYRLPDYSGATQTGIEYGYDKQLHGKAGVKSVVVNNLGYRQTENIWTPAEPGQNVVLTIDVKFQQKAEKFLQVYGPNTRGALVVMDVQSGDILALASSPTLDPNDSVRGYPPGELTRRQDPKLRPEINRATQENYAPGSIFKTVVGLACLEAGIDPSYTIYNPGYIFVGKSRIGDLAPPGQYDFRTALMKSSNTYFITNGMRAGIESIIRLAQSLHLGERTGLQTRQETSGRFPDLQRIQSEWYDGDTAHICIGQGKMDVTPLQMAVMIAAIANGGKVLWPRLVARIEPPDPATGGQTNFFQSGRIRDSLRVKPQSLKLVRDAMLADVEDPAGSGNKAFVAGMQICGKTGTAQVMDTRNKVIGETTWFASFAPYDRPRYALIVMVENEANVGSGGKTCAPIAHSIYLALQERERAELEKPQRLAQAN